MSEDSLWASRCNLVSTLIFFSNLFFYSNFWIMTWQM